MFALPTETLVELPGGHTPRRAPECGFCLRLNQPTSLPAWLEQLIGYTNKALSRALAYLAELSLAENNRQG